MLARLDALPSGALKRTGRGIEKESLRTRPDGMLADTPHPDALGSALTHPHITTDFSESQLELITGVHETAAGCLDELTEIHRVVYRALGDEILWATSMPCMLPADDRIPIGRYGTSNIGTAKSVYRHGLSHRYGRRMQTISGIHYNFSLPEDAWDAIQRAEGVAGPVDQYRNAAYFSLIRNFRRDSWLLLYLFGASPAVCGSFVAGREHALQPLARGTLYLPYATSLRMGPLGYQSDAQRSLAVSYNSLKSYAGSIQRALTEPYPAYEAIGLRRGDQYLQLATTLLQIENEFYGTIRPKRRVLPGERPLRALARRGVEYIEVRCMDVDPFEPVGINGQTTRFIDAFLLHCLLSPSAPDTPEEIAFGARNQHRVAERGRDPELTLYCGDAERPMRERAREILDGCAPIVAALDAARGDRNGREALESARASLEAPELTPSARILATVQEDYDDSFMHFALAQSRHHAREHLRAPLAAATLSRYAEMAEESRSAQRAIEAGDTESFEEFRKHYISQDLLGAG
ncbi:MAG: glutamate--cysteine ligase [Burkholderiaceae bacterium]|nr:glutamate--cysteine ligase [Burkholderiaceae bacterium]